MDDFRAPRWLPGGHVQTIWPALFSRRFDGAAPVFRRERWATPDGDFVDVDWQGDDRAAPLLVLFHGLEGSSSSHYAQAFAAEARAARLALRGAALSRLLGRDQPRAARLSLGRPRGSRLDAGALSRAARRADRRGRRLARRQRAAALRRGSRRRARAQRVARHRRGLGAARPRRRRRARSAAASAARSTRACSCAR